MQSTFKNPSNQSPAITAKKIVEIFTRLIEIKSPSIYHTGDKINFSFKGGVNLKIKGTLIFINQTVKLEYDLTPKGITSSKISNAFVTELNLFFQLQ